MTIAKNYTALENAFAAAEKNGSTEVQAGVFVCSSEYMICEQNSWADEDPSKNVDFTIYKFWLTVDSGEDPEGISDLADLIKMMS
jgi:hypothetical protein